MRTTCTQHGPLQPRTELEARLPAEIRERNPCDLIHAWNLRDKRAKKKKGKPRLGHLLIENKPVVTRGEGGLGDGDEGGRLCPTRCCTPEILRCVLTILEFKKILD